MAIIYSGICCAICKKVISDELLDHGDFVSTMHFVEDSSHELCLFSDAAMHKDCFMAWDKRAEFVQLYNDTIGKLTWGNGTYHQMGDDGQIDSLIR